MAFNYNGPNTVAQNLHPTMSVSPIAIRGSIHATVLPSGTSEFYVAHWDGETLQAPAGVSPDLLLVTDSTNIPDAVLLGSKVLAFENAYTPQSQIDWTQTYPDQVINYHAGGIVVGSLGNDSITMWGNGNSMVEGGEGNDLVYTGSGDDTIASGKGNDSIYAGDGIDTVRLAGARENYSHHVLEDGSVQITNNTTSAVTTLFDTEIVSFGTGGSLVITNNVSDASTMRLYEVLLGRAPDADGAKFWLGELDKGYNPYDAINGFLNSAEYLADNADISNNLFVNSLYEKALNRAADQEGADYWEALLNTGTSHAEVAYFFVSGAEAAAVSQSVIQLPTPATEIEIIGQTPTEDDHSGHAM